MPVLTKINSNVIADDAISGDKLGGSAYLANSTTQNITGTYSENRLYTSDAYTLSGNATVNSELILSSVKPNTDVVLTAGGAYTITGTGVLSGGDMYGRNTLTGMTGELGSAVTGAPALTGGTLGSNVGFPAGHVIKHSYVTLGADVARHGATGNYTMWTPTYTPTGGSGTRIITNFHVAFATYDLNDQSAELKFKYDITGDNITNLTDQYNTYWNSVMTEGTGGTVQRLYVGSSRALRERTITGNAPIIYTLKIELFDSSSHYVDWMGNGTESETCLEIWEITT